MHTPQKPRNYSEARDETREAVGKNDACSTYFLGVHLGDADRTFGSHPLNPENYSRKREKTPREAAMGETRPTYFVVRPKGYKKNNPRTFWPYSRADFPCVGSLSLNGASPALRRKTCRGIATMPFIRLGVSTHKPGRCLSEIRQPEGVHDGVDQGVGKDQNHGG